MYVTDKTPEQEVVILYEMIEAGETTAEDIAEELDYREKAMEGGRWNDALYLCSTEGLQAWEWEKLRQERIACRFFLRPQASNGES